MSLVNVIGGFLAAENYITPSKYVEAPLAGARFVAPLEELIGESLKKFLDARVENLFRQTEIDRRILGILGVDVASPLKQSFRIRRKENELVF